MTPNRIGITLWYTRSINFDSKSWSLLKQEVPREPLPISVKTSSVHPCHHQDNRRLPIFSRNDDLQGCCMCWEGVSVLDTSGLADTMTTTDEISLILLPTWNLEDNISFPSIRHFRHPKPLSGRKVKVELVIGWYTGPPIQWNRRHVSYKSTILSLIWSWVYYPVTHSFNSRITDYVPFTSL